MRHFLRLVNNCKTNRKYVSYLVLLSLIDHCSRSLCNQFEKPNVSREAFAFPVTSVICGPVAPCLSVFCVLYSLSLHNHENSIITRYMSLSCYQVIASYMSTSYFQDIASYTSYLIIKTLPVT